ncbi:MAG: tetratricopeptide repeat-containing sensor histidine kinase [Balneolaceae bacterium]|nr:tetratricopeptide repeat-containing sensor histidine kinase [Balneolaceae bacterium]MCH8548707.1 tetratricopeptide repeat-containing sensor histidine kinase [Balneolaceae bacterium]
MVKLTICLLFAVFAGTPLFGAISVQEDPVNTQRGGTYYIHDPVEDVFNTVIVEEATVDSLLDLGYESRNSNSRLSYHLANEALAMSEILDYRLGITESTNLLGIKHLDFGQYDSALKYFLSAKEMNRELDRREMDPVFLNNIALVHIQQEDYERAAAYLNHSMEMDRELGQFEDGYLSMNNLGVIYRRQGLYEQALEQFRKSKKLSYEAGDNPLLHHIAILNIGNTYRNLERFDESLAYMTRALDYFENSDNRVQLITTYLFLGQLHKDLGDFDKALEYGGMSLEQASYSLYRDRIRDAHELLSEIYEARGNYQLAYAHYKNFHAASDSLMNAERSNMINEMQIRFDVQQKNREIEVLNQEARLQEAQLSQQVLQQWFLIAVLALMVIIAALLFYTNHQKKASNRILRKRREEIEKKNRELEKLNKQKDDFLGMAAHDLRNPLSGIRSATELINMEEKADMKLIREYTSMIQISSDRMLNLLNQLLDIQSINEHANRSLQEKLILSDTLQQSVSNYETTASAKEITLEVDIEDENLEVIGNINNVTRIFDNLISNAIKYSPAGSRVGIRQTRIDNSAVVEVKDYGPGISEEDQEKLFGRYTRLSNVPTGDEKSTGLGLYIVKKLVTSMNGRVTCESKQGEGSLFTVSFPLAEENPALVREEGAYA